MRADAEQVLISAAQHNQRLDNFLLKRLRNIPRTRVYRLIRKGEVRVNKKRCRPEYKLQLGDQVRIPPMWIEPERSSAARLPPQLLTRLEQAILYENDHILIIDKPGGLAVHSGSGVAYGCIDIVRQLRSEQDIDLVHRLDRDTSGCLLFGKHRPALLAMQQALRDGSLKKYYCALVKGRWSREYTEINHALRKYHLANGERRVRVDSEGKSALSRVALSQTYEGYSLIRIELVSGRTHQIRVHCQAEGHPLVGDEKYGDEAFNREMRGRGIKRLMLHAMRLELPATDYTSDIVINAPLPPEFEQLFCGQRRCDGENHD